MPGSAETPALVRSWHLDGDGGGPGELFGTLLLIDLLHAGPALPAAELVRSIVDSVSAFSQGKRSDDLTLLAVGALSRSVSFRMPGDVGHLDEAMQTIRAVVQAYGTTFAYELELGGTTGASSSCAGPGEPTMVNDPAGRRRLAIFRILQSF